MKLVLAVEATSWDANVPGTAVSVSCEKSARERFFGVTANGDCGSLIVPLISESYEKPTWIGWSRYSMFASLFHDHGFSIVFFESNRTEHGPFSPNAAATDGEPGPPCSQRERGAFSGWLLRASKNQKKEWTG
jgi:hypothetical protein